MPHKRTFTDTSILLESRLQYASGIDFKSLCRTNLETVAATYAVFCLLCLSALKGDTLVPADIFASSAADALILVHHTYPVCFSKFLLPFLGKTLVHVEELEGFSLKFLHRLEAILVHP